LTACEPDASMTFAPLDLDGAPSPESALPA
jgi:hypothetical protein